MIPFDADDRRQVEALAELEARKSYDPSKGSLPRWIANHKRWRVQDELKRLDPLSSGHRKAVKNGAASVRHIPLDEIAEEQILKPRSGRRKRAQKSRPRFNAHCSSCGLGVSCTERLRACPKCGADLWALTEMETQVAAMLGKGMTAKDVAASFNIAVKTAESHKHRVYKKLSVHTSPQLVRRLVEKGVMKLEDIPLEAE